MTHPKGPPERASEPPRPENADAAFIRRRRAVFIATALAGLGSATNGCDCAPRPCLDVAMPEEPQTSTPTSTATASSSAASSASAAPSSTPAVYPSSSGEPTPPPTVCLEVYVPPPEPCLNIRRP
ncbi:MAG: hypothetical protein U0271_27645 [Polyangiaceae bacterium]